MRFSFYGHKVCFLNCHLAAHMNHALQRVDEFEHILETQEFDTDDGRRVLDHKSVKHREKEPPRKAQGLPHNHNME